MSYWSDCIEAICKMQQEEVWKMLDSTYIIKLAETNDTVKTFVEQENDLLWKHTHRKVASLSMFILQEKAKEVPNPMDFDIFNDYVMRKKSVVEEYQARMKWVMGFKKLWHEQDEFGMTFILGNASEGKKLAWLLDHMS